MQFKNLQDLFKKFSNEEVCREYLAQQRWNGHYVSYKQMNAYCNEFAYRYNTRKTTDPQRFTESLSRAEGKRLKFDQLTDKWYRES